MIRRYTGRRFARYSSVPLSKVLLRGCTSWVRRLASPRERKCTHEQDQRPKADQQSNSDAGGLEAKLNVVLARRDGHDSEQHIATQHGHGLAVDGCRPTRIKGVAEDQPGVGR